MELALPMIADTSDPAPLSVQRLSKSYGNKEVVGGISFDVGHGSIVGLLGGNGAGKTTTLAMIMGLVSPSRGRILCFGEPATHLDRRHVGLMNFASQYIDMPMRLTVRENLTVCGLLYGVGGLRERIADLAGEFGIEDLLGRPFGSLSAGQRMRVALAKALVNQPRILLLDEPTASLDPDAADSIRSLLEAYRAKTGAAILLASHSMVEVERLCDDALLLSAGRIVECGRPADLMRRHNCTSMEEVFLTVLRRQVG